MNRLTSALFPLANATGTDISPFAQREQAFDDMLASATKFDGSYEAARDRFYQFDDLKRKVA